MGEVVVTAQRREGRLQDVPTTVIAISGAQLEALGIEGA
jgi:outer membrane receptor protein involved in Fe transport